VALLVTMHFMPANASCTSVPVLMVLSIIIGLASATCDLICDIVAPRKPKSE